MSQVGIQTISENAQGQESTGHSMNLYEYYLGLQTLSGWIRQN